MEENLVNVFRRRCLFFFFPLERPGINGFGLSCDLTLRVNQKIGLRHHSHTLGEPGDDCIKSFLLSIDGCDCSGSDLNLFGHVHAAFLFDVDQLSLARIQHSTPGNSQDRPRRCLRLFH